MRPIGRNGIHHSIVIYLWSVDISSASDVGARFERHSPKDKEAPDTARRARYAVWGPPPTPIITRDSPHKEDKHTIWRPARNAEIREILNFMKNYVLNIFWHNTQNTRNINRCRASGLICRSTISPLKHIHQLSHKRLNFTKIVILKILKNTTKHSQHRWFSQIWAHA